MAHNGQNDHLGQNDFIPNCILAFARPKWTITVHFGPFWPEEVHFGPFRSANRTLATPDHPSGPVRDNPLPIAGGVYRTHFPCFHRYRASIAEIPFCWGGIAPPLRTLSKEGMFRKGGGGSTPDWPCPKCAARLLSPLCPHPR